MIDYKLENAKMIEGLNKLNKDLITLLKIDGKEYTFEINIRTIAGLNKGVPKFMDKVKLCLELSETLVEEPYIGTFSGSNIPFHPHVKRHKLPFLRKKGRWIDFKHSPKEESLFQFLIKIIRSLQYQKDFICEDTKNIGNYDALDWYNHFNKQSSQNFPIDNSALFKTDESLIIAPESKLKIKQTSSKKFSIQNETEKYQPEEREKGKLEIDEQLNATCKLKNTSHELYINYDAHRTIFNHIDWNKITKRNRVEQGGILVGKVFRDVQINTTVGIVEKAIPAIDTEGSSTHLRLNHENWKNIIDEIDTQSEDLSGQIIGWYHTHPNQLDVFMSEVDVNTQQQFFPNDWQFAIVLNPHKRIWKTFYGRNATECKGFMLKDIRQRNESLMNKKKV